MAVLWILGEAKSGKSELAEEIFTRLPGRKFYIGTFPRTPEHMDAIRKHAERRPEDWELIEVTDRLDLATEVIKRSGRDRVTATLLDGWGVCVEQRALEWGKENVDVTMADETRFIDEIYREYCRLATSCDYLIVVDHISPEAPTLADYERNRVAWRMRTVVTRCISEADKVIYHDREDVSHRDTSYVEQVAAEMISSHR